ncbi:translation initiation factor [Hydrogenimonas sp. SS33]|uniref:translation initiation factor n=1 Tax=Hydrogenimonas leucolamina TaxID=2954236 RepID=UPI00336BFBD9
MARGEKLDIEFSSFDEGWEADNRKTEQKPVAETLAPQKHRLVFKKEKRRGKPVTLIGEFFLEESDAKALLKRLKKALGSGGTYKEGWMELQGDKAPQIRELLEKEGFGFR